MTKTRLLAVAVLLSFALGTSALAAAQDERTPEAGAAVQAQQGTAMNQADQEEIFRPQGTVITPESSIERPEDAGVRAHTNIKIFVPAGRPMSTLTPDYPIAETPASLACVYQVGATYPGCTPGGGTGGGTGGWGAIALVDAYDNPNAASNLATFSATWGLPAANFTKVYANTSFGTLNGYTASCSGTPAGNTSWGLEEDLDIEWAHAMAPNAQIYLIEACSNSNSDLFFAEQVAGIKVDAAGGGDISNSYGEAEFSGEVGTVDDVFYRYYYNKITYFASAGDSGWGAAYPSSSPWVVSAGGTTVNRNANGSFVNESCWSGSGGGVSRYELWQSPPNILNGMGPWSDFQYELFGGYPFVSAPRQTPDFAFDADPNTGVYIYDTYGYNGWVVVGGTSVASPSLAGIVNSAGNELGQTPPGGGYYHTGENNLLYAQLFATTAYSTNFYDVTTGCNGTGHCAAAGYDQCTGVGTPRGKLGK